MSTKEDRILLSRDTRLLVRRSVREFIYLESDKIQEQIKQILRATATAAIPALLTRCLACNEPLSDIARESVRERVPPYVFQTQKSFKLCPRCRKIYWAGTHRQSVLRTWRSSPLTEGTCNPRRGNRLKKQVTLRLNTDAIAYCKALAGETGIPYQNLIDLYLTECAHSANKLTLKWGPPEWFPPMSAAAILSN